MEQSSYIPEHLNEITPSWLSSVLNSKVDSVELNILGADHGFMGDVVRVKLKGSKNLPSSVVIKLPKRENRVFGELLGIYEREIMFYREFGDSQALQIPKPYYSEFDRDKGSEKQAQILSLLDRLPLFMVHWVNSIGSKIAASKNRRYILLIEDLSFMEPGDQVKGLNPEGCIQVLRGIAKMHHQYWQSSVLENHFWLLPIDIDARLRFGVFNDHVEDFRKTSSKTFEPHLQALQTAGPNFLRDFFASTPTTLIHCDLRLDNILFEGDNCKYIDWQLTRSGPAAYDVAYFLSSALPVETTKKELESVSRDYHRSLNIENYSYEDLQTDYARGLRMVLLNLTHTGDVELGDDRGKKMMDIWIERLLARLEQSH